MAIVETVLMTNDAGAEVRVNKSELEKWSALGYAPVDPTQTPPTDSLEQDAEITPEEPDVELVAIKKGDRTVEIPVSELETHIAAGWELA